MSPVITGAPPDELAARYAAAGVDPLTTGIAIAHSQAPDGSALATVALEDLLVLLVLAGLASRLAATDPAPGSVA